MAEASGAVLGLPSSWKEGLTTLDQTFFRGGFEPQPNDVFIGLMGVTGAGKSTFIDLLTDSDEIKVGHGLQSCTQEVKAYLYRYRYSDDINVYLIDTPGFDDTNRSDIDVLWEIVTWLSDSLRMDVKLSGMLYFHRIIDPRMQGSANKNLHMFKALCGSGQFTNVILVTTMWEIVNQDLGAAREKELIDTEEFWGLMLKNGSRVERHNNTQESAKRIVQKFVEKKKVELDIQNEIVRQQRDLHDTTAGKTLEYELAQERERSEQREAKARREYEKALRHQKEGLDELAKALQQQQEEARREVQKRNEDLERLKMSLKASDLRAENERRKRELQEKEQQRLKRIAEEKSKALNGSRFPVKPKTRSHPGPNRIQECRSITLIDDSYFFCGPDQSESKLPLQVQKRLSSLGFDDIELRSSIPGLFARFKALFNYPLGVGVRAFALGTSNSVYIHHHKNGSCKEMSFLPDYPGLAEVLAKYRLEDGGTNFGCPRYVSLGVNGHYFIRSNSHSVWDLPRDILEQPWWQGDKIKAVWLGMNDAWVVQLKNGATRKDLKGQYSNSDHLLREKIQTGFSTKRPGQRIKAMALNLTNPESYAAVWGDSGVVYHSAGEFDGFVFEEFATKNFGTSF